MTEPFENQRSQYSSNDLCLCKHGHIYYRLLRERTSLQKHSRSRDFTVLPAIHMFIHERHKSYLPLPSQPT